jgi:hypothetical protein
MQGVETIRKAGVDYAIIVRGDASSDDKYNFLCPDQFPFQLGVNFYKQGDVVRDHEHIQRTLTVTLFQELVMVARGRARLRLFDLRREPLGEWTLEAGDFVLLIAGAHGFDLLEDTKIVEIKQGPFDPKVNDKVFI